MSDKTVKIDKIVHSILSTNPELRFSIPQLRDMYLSLSKVNASQDSAYKFVYRQIKILVSGGLLELIRDDSNNGSRYSINERFTQAKFSFSNPPKMAKGHYPAVTKIMTSTKTKQGAHLDNDKSCSPMRELEQTLKQYQVDLLASIGESEEYKKQFALFPEQRVFLEQQYEQAKERSSKFIGQIKATKVLLQHYTQSH
ncbi:hypothetical protein L4D76_01635 [Photobacterium sagamiensis]|uniref:hypothetical protein n=1 Tax=Photobacterium sagamiensis TaxID=2910241 RepID=UPI003D0AC37E